MYPAKTPTLPRTTAEVREPLRSWSIEILFVCILRIRAVREEATRLLQAEHFDRPDERHLGVLWGLLVEMHPLHDRERIPYMVLVDRVLDLVPRSDAHDAVLTADQFERLAAMPTAHDPDRPEGGDRGLLYWAYREVDDDDVTAEQGFDLLKQFLLERAIYEPLRDAATVTAAGDFANLDAIYEEGLASRERITAISEDAYGNLDRPEGGSPAVATFSTGIEWLDPSMGGGQAAPEIAGLLGPTGAGKSTMALQMALGTSEHLRRAHDESGAPLRHVVVVSYEDDHPRFLTRALACAATIHKDELLGMDPQADSLSRRGRLKDYERKLFAREPGFDPETWPGEYDRMLVAQQEFTRNFHFIYMGGNRGDGFVDEIAAHLARARDRHGWEYAAVYVDSLDWLVGNYMAAQGLNARHHKRGAILEAVPMLRRRVGERFGASVWVTNQLAGANFTLSSTTRFDHSDASDAKDWARALDWHWAIGNLDPGYNTVLHCSKARRSANRGDTLAVGLRGEFGHFVSLDKTHVITPSGIVPREVDEICVAPKAHRGQRWRTAKVVLGNTRDLGDDSPAGTWAP